MLIDEQFRLPSIHVPDGVMFGYPTRLVDSWSPEVERIWMPAYMLEGPAVVVRAFNGETGDLAYGPRLRNPIRRFKRSQIRIGVADGDFAYDSRYNFEGNMDHVLENIAPPAMLARRVLRARLGRDCRVIVIVREGASAMALRILELLSIPVIATDCGVKGRVVEVLAIPRPDQEPQPIDSGILRAVYPRLYDQPLPGYEADTPAKIFISRRRSRALVNEEQIWDVLRRRGFTRFYFEELPIERQWSLLANAREVVGIHGAAFGGLVHRHSLNASRGTPTTIRLTELFGAGYIVRHYRNHAAVLGGRWIAVRGRIQPKIIRDLDLRGLARSHEADRILLDPGALEQALHFEDERFLTAQPLNSDRDWWCTS
jgi:Glycosyltransferase 61